MQELYFVLETQNFRLEIHRYKSEPIIRQIKAVDMLTEAQIYAFLDFICEMPMDDVNKRRALINIFVHSVYLYDDHFTIIINASKKPLSIDNIPLDEIEEAFEGENEGKEGRSSMTTPAPPKRKAYTTVSAFLFSFGGTDEEFNPLPRQPSALKFRYAFAEGETLPFCPTGKCRSPLPSGKANFRRSPLPKEYHKPF